MQSIDEANKNVVSDRKIEIDSLKTKLGPLHMTIKEVSHLSPSLLSSLPPPSHLPPTSRPPRSSGSSHL